MRHAAPRRAARAVENAEQVQPSAAGAKKGPCPDATNAGRRRYQPPTLLGVAKRLAVALPAARARRCPGRIDDATTVTAREAMRNR